MRKLVIWFIILFVLIAVVRGHSYFSSVENYKRNVQALQVQNVDFSGIPDGEYLGDCDVNFVRARVSVVIKDHAIQHIALLEHHHERGAAAEVLPSKIVSEQRIDVDVISGATSSSKVIQEAVYNALTGKRTIESQR